MTVLPHEASTARQDAGSWRDDAVRWSMTGRQIREAAAAELPPRSQQLDRAGQLLEQAALHLAEANNAALLAVRILDPRQPRTGPPER